MSWANDFSTLIDEGYVPTGVKPKTIKAGGGKADYYDTSTLGRVLEAMMKQKQKAAADLEEKQKGMEKKADMYKTLRESGYSTQNAYEAVMKAQYPKEGPTEKSKFETEREKSEAETIKIKADGVTLPKTKLQASIMQKIMLDEELTAGEQKIYDETIKGKGDELAGLFSDNTSNAGQVKAKILDKVANDETLTAGEQRIYDEVISKTSGKGIQRNGKKVAVISPDGIPGFLPESQLNAALKQGYKRR